MTLVVSVVLSRLYGGRRGHTIRLVLYLVLPSFSWTARPAFHWVRELVIFAAVSCLWMVGPWRASRPNHRSVLID